MAGQSLFSTLLSWVFVIFLLRENVIAKNIIKFPLLMPNAVPKHKDSYLCTGIRLDPQEDYFIVGFEPNATSKTAHHMIVSGCSTPGSFDETWNCGHMGAKDESLASAGVCGKDQKIIYAWAQDAPELKLPEGVGFKVGGRTDMQYLVLQVHYASAERFKGTNLKDDSGVFLKYTKEPQPKTAGVLVMLTGGRVMPHSIEYMEAACTIEENIVLHPFAFRTHTHALGRVVSGYKVENADRGPVWTLIGKKDPQLPQMFYPVTKDITISKGDTIASRCTMESNRDTVTRVGMTADDEMCNFYIMYWAESESDHKKVRGCSTYGPPLYYWKQNKLLINPPDDASALNVI